MHCLSATVSTALGWATQLAVCSGQASWVRGRAAVFSSGWGYKLVPLPRWSGRTGSKTGKALRGLDSSRPVSQVSWLNRAAGSARQSSAPAGTRLQGSSRGGRCGSAGVAAAFLGRGPAELHSAVGGAVRAAVRRPRRPRARVPAASPVGGAPSKLPPVRGQKPAPGPQAHTLRPTGLPGQTCCRSRAEPLAGTAAWA